MFSFNFENTTKLRFFLYKYYGFNSAITQYGSSGVIIKTWCWRGF